MNKVYLVDKEAGVYNFHCPGCGYGHSFRTKPYTDKLGRVHPTWSFNGDLEKPTFSPSLLVNSHLPKIRCHLFLTEGQLRYCNDSHHELAGQTVECPEWDEDAP